jgi:hypothetical protein
MMAGFGIGVREKDWIWHVWICADGVTEATWMAVYGIGMWKTTSCISLEARLLVIE